MAHDELRAVGERFLQQGQRIARVAVEGLEGALVTLGSQGAGAGEDIA